VKRGDALLCSEEYYVQEAKRQGVGPIRVIGQSKLRISEDIVHECFENLLVDVRSCKLLTTVGKRLDRREALAHMDVYSRMKGPARGDNMSLRMQFTPQVHGYSLIR
jgi:translation initiation factor 4G